ncbi:hypothetical protein [Thauera sp.]|jgi:hypothetical protein|uniref:hypothetical protein n=1 Tax=Thauera sp. TaxID=1905334 RepID=UPI00260DC3B1|nr:hypothetical protein [Thauera sp.]MCK6408958.1 hypothetical protein [Thauera sp.]
MKLLDTRSPDAAPIDPDRRRLLLGAALLIEFDHENRLIPSLPAIDPQQYSYFAWVMKIDLLKPACMAVAKGRV